jgi:hypothetical protein
MGPGFRQPDVGRLQISVVTALEILRRWKEDQGRLDGLKDNLAIGVFPPALEPAEGFQPAFP